MRAALLAALPVLIVVAPLGLAACNTAEGLGRDVESTGDAIEDTARDVRD